MPVAGTSKEPTVTQISPSKSQPSSSVQPTTKRNWVNLSDRVMLSFKEKNDIQNDKKLCCNIIDFAQQLLQQQFPSVNGLQFTGYAPILENTGKWTYSLQITREIPPSVQIHHTGHAHWVLSIQDTSGTVFLLDSKNPRQTVSASTQIQMSRIYSSNGNVIPVNLPTVQQQTNSIDCGVFAIAYATEFCFNQYTGGKG